MKNILKNVEILKNLDDKDLDNLSLFCQIKKVSKGDVLFHEGEDANAMYLLTIGGFDITKKIKGNNIRLGTVSAEEFLGEMALFGDKGKRMATAIATMDSELITILSFSIKELANKNPELLTKIKDLINQRLLSNKVLEDKIV